MNKSELAQIAKKLVVKGKGLLAADWSLGTSEKHFKKNNIEHTEENRRKYRQMLFSTPGIEEFISGVIMFDETVRQTNDEGVFFPKHLEDRGIIPGIKVDQGKDEENGEFITKGINSLTDRLKEYKPMGLVFTKWRAAIKITNKLPTDKNINKNARLLTEFAIISQNHGLVPIIEPEVLMDGEHDIKRSQEVTYKTLKQVFLELSKKKVLMEAMLLKPNWVHPGKDYPGKPKNTEIAEATLKMFREVVPENIGGIVFLSGGDSPEDSTKHLNAIDKKKGHPWELSFSFGRALQKEALKAWQGKKENIPIAQRLFYKRARLVSMAREGKL